MTHEIWCLLGPMILRMLDALGALLLIIAPWVLANLMVDIVLGVIGGIGSIAKTIKNHFKQKREKAKHEEKMKAKREEIRKKCHAKSQTITQ